VNLCVVADLADEQCKTTDLNRKRAPNPAFAALSSVRCSRAGIQRRAALAGVVVFTLPSTIGDTSQARFLRTS
jgi:hypothetical protein